jgi:hypothetical protein
MIEFVEVSKRTISSSTSRTSLVEKSEPGSTKTAKFDVEPLLLVLSVVLSLVLSVEPPICSRLHARNAVHALTNMNSPNDFAIFPVMSFSS